MGEIEKGVEHLSNAVAVCGQPQQLLQVLQQTLPPQVFRLLLDRLPIVGQVSRKFPELIPRHNADSVHLQRLMMSAAQSGLVMAEEDVE